MSQPQLPYYRASTELRERVVASVRAASAAPRSLRPWQFLPLLAAAAVLVLVAGGAWRTGRGGARRDAEFSGVLSAHLRSLTPSHLADVASSDQHTVKPWFAGRLDFSPPVVDLAASGFPLVGGRLDFVADRPAAALVYTRRSHIINVFVQPAANGDDASPAKSERHGYHVLRWSSGEMRFWAVSDVNEVELEQFRDLLRAAGAPASSGSR
jgi:anti-sigma factor RsiW